FTAWVMMGSDTIRVTSNTNMTSISGVVLISHMTAPALVPTLIAIVRFSSVLARAAHAVVGLREEAHLYDAAALQRIQHATHRLVARIPVGTDVHFGLRLLHGGHFHVGQEIVLVGHALIVPVDVAVLVDGDSDVLRLRLRRDVHSLRQ